MAVHTCNLNTLVVERGRSGVQGQPQLHRNFKASFRSPSLRYRDAHHQDFSDHVVGYCVETSHGREAYFASQFRGISVHLGGWRHGTISASRILRHQLSTQSGGRNSGKVDWNKVWASLDTAHMWCTDTYAGNTQTQK